MKKCIILANGNPPSKKLVSVLYAKGYNTLFCADGGANSAFKLNLNPNYIIGDFDSVRLEVLEFYKSSCKIINLKRQNDTDVEKCLKHAIKLGFTHALVLAATGDRLDHSFCNLGILLKFHSQIEVELIHQKSLLKVYEGDVTLKCTKGEVISLYGFDYKTKITSKGLKYPINTTSLPFGIKESTSNLAKTSEVELKIRRGKIFVIRNFKTMVDNDLF